MGFVKLSNMPSPPKLRVSSVQNLKGGLNIHDLAWQISADQSPEMKNMWWRDGVLQSRPGLTKYNFGYVQPMGAEPSSDLTNIRSYEHPYQGWYVFHDPLGARFVAVTERDPLHIVSIADSTSEEGDVFTVEHPDGVFFVYNDVLYYKSKGGYYKITASEDTDPDFADLRKLVAEEVVGYVPTILINADPAQAGVGDLYQPVNRLSPYRTVLYNCDKDTAELYLPEYVSPDCGLTTVEYLKTDGTWHTFKTGYMFQTKPHQKVTFITLDESLGAQFSDFAADASNNVRLTYATMLPSKMAEDAFCKSIMDCNIVSVYGGGSGLCVVMAGSESQPNAYFWSGNTDVAMDPTYFPAEHYNLAGDVSDPITALGQQQNMLVIFQKRRIGRCVFGTTEVDGRVFITMDYTTVNPQIGCDVPGSVRLVENNLVFANLKSGVMFLKDSSSAYENNIVNISRNVEASLSAEGILLDLSVSPTSVVSLDDGKRYWLCTNDHVWLWDYSLGGSVNDAKSLSWFYFDAVKTPGCWLETDREIPAYIGTDGYYRRFETIVEDESFSGMVWWSKYEPFEKSLALPIQDFGTYEVLKNVDKAIFVVKSSGDARIDIEYETDYATRKDLTPIMTYGSRTWVPRNLAEGRILRFTKFAVTAVRKPRCLHIRHFLVRLKNSNRGEDIAFVSAQIYYTLQGVDR